MSCGESTGDLRCYIKRLTELKRSPQLARTQGLSVNELSRDEMT